MNGSRPIRRAVTPAAPLALAALLIAGVATAEELDPSRVGWSSLSFEARKLAFSLASTIELTLTGSEDIAAELRRPFEGEAIEPAGDRTAVIKLDAEGVGADTTTWMWLDPATGVAYQRQQLSWGRRKRNKTLRFTDSGVEVFFGRAAEGESPDRPETWTGGTHRFDDYPDWLRGGVRVSEPTVVFYLLAAAPLEKAGDRVQIPVWSNEKLVLMEASVAGMDRVRVDYQRDGERVKGGVQALKVLVDAHRLGPDSDREHLEILGIRGDIEIHLDPETRAPLLISGRVPVAGKTKVRLRSLTLR